MATTAKLSEYELVALRDHAAEVMQHAACDRLRWYDPEKTGDQSPEQVREEEHQRMIAASEVYAALRSADLEFGRHRKRGPHPESVQAEITDAGMAWVAELRDELRGSLKGRRGTIEIDESAPGETFYVLDGICGGEECTPTE